MERVKKIQMQFVLVILICLVAFSPEWGWSEKITGIVHEVNILIPPTMKNSPETLETKIDCYDVYTGEALDCPCTHEVKGLAEPYIGSTDAAIDNNGGHVHNYDTRPFFYPADGGLVSTFDLDPENKKRVVSSTHSSFELISHAIPEVSGVIVTETLIEAPPKYTCGWGCFTDKSTKYKTNINVAVYETQIIDDWPFVILLGFPLSELPNPGTDDHYEKCRSEACPDPVSVTTHPKGFYGTSDTLINLKRIAKKYYGKTNRNLSINDISLPKGGLFDYENTWAKPHSSHRTGTDADINKSVTDVKQLIDAVKKVAGENEHPSLNIETNNSNHLHIDFD